MAYKRLETDELDDDLINRFNKVITINDDTPLLCPNVHTFKVIIFIHSGITLVIIKLLF